MTTQDTHGGHGDGDAGAGDAQGLAQEVARAGFYPEVVLGVLTTALAGEETLSFLVQPETTFAEAVHRHLTLLALTSTRLIVVHVDDAVGEDGAPLAIATSEAVPVASIGSVALTHGVTRPAAGGGSLAEVTIAVSWGAVRRLELEPVVCPDPACEADHGLSGVSVPDDIVVRVAAGVEGDDAVHRARAFAQALSAATVRVAGAA
ncbi:DUF5998 family protein [Actinomyces faecalis]|uniref:DUF5998 family protein n=1 Tax=Actinomyces faecalis TaxID=2722820 RepID=UPI001F48C8C4|nr:DUF5998 family protein [Actinomyces faecalis]